MKERIRERYWIHSGHGIPVCGDGVAKTWPGSTLPSAISFDNPYVMQFDGTDDYVDQIK